MLKSARNVFAFLLCLSESCSTAQIAVRMLPPGEVINSDTALDRASKASSLTFEGKPFHAIMEVGAAGTPHSGRIEVWWTSSARYRVDITSSDFVESKIVSNGMSRAKITGSFYPRWLESFELALMKPVATEANFRGAEKSVSLRKEFPGSISRDDRINGITDVTTAGKVLFFGPAPFVGHVASFNYSMTFSDWQPFEGKTIPRTYKSSPEVQNTLTGQQSVPSQVFLTGQLTTLEILDRDGEKQIVFDPAAQNSSPISTSFISTQKEEGRLESAPEIEWPSVREGRTDGYMIVYARTDRTGQVQESAQFSSDQPALEAFGVQQALKFKFKPLIVDRVAVQIEMPLVLHFKTRIEDPIPILTAEQMKLQMVSCSPALPAPGTVPSGDVLRYQISVDETGKLAGMGPLPSPVAPHIGPGWISTMRSFDSCTFKPYISNGKATYYKGAIEVTAP